MITLEAAVVAQNAAKGEADFSSGLSFAANFFDAEMKTAALVNVRHYPEQVVAQHQVERFSQPEIRVLDNVLRQGMVESLAGTPLTLLDWLGTNRRTINGLTALVSEYRRSGPNGAMRVRLVRVLDAGRSFTLTISYRENQTTLLEPITSYVITTLRRN